MSKKDYIEIEVFVGYDSEHSEQTEVGVLKGKEISKTVCISIDEAREQVQQAVYGLDYPEASEFAKKYEN